MVAQISANCLFFCKLQLAEKQAIGELRNDPSSNFISGLSFSHTTAICIYLI